MNGTTIFGLILIALGMVVSGDAKSFGMKTPSAGIAVAGVGFLIAVFGYFGSAGHEGQNRGQVGRRVRDHSV
jgi:hypothetical protein